MTKHEKERFPVVDNNGDYIWRFPLKAKHGCPSNKSNDAFVELFRSQLDEMLKFVILTQAGKKVRIDGFYLINQPDCKYPIWQTE